MEYHKLSFFHPYIYVCINVYIYTCTFIHICEICVYDVIIFQIPLEFTKIQYVAY